MTIENNIDNEAQAAEQKSNDAKLILAPLAKYAVVAVIMVSIIITTAIMLDRELNTIDHDIASLKAELADANAIAKAETNSVNDTAIEAESIVTDTDSVVEQVAVTIITEEINDGTVAAADTANNTNDTIVSTLNTADLAQDTSTDAVATTSAEAVAEATELTQTNEQSVSTAKADQTTSHAANSKVTRASRIDAFKASMQAHIADRNNYLNTLDTKSLEDFKASQQKTIAMMRKQISRQQAIIEQMRSRNQDAYEMRAASIKRMQAARDRSLERI